MNLKKKWLAIVILIILGFSTIDAQFAYISVPITDSRLGGWKAGNPSNGEIFETKYVDVIIQDPVRNLDIFIGQLNLDDTQKNYTLTCPDSVGITGNTLNLKFVYGYHNEWWTLLAGGGDVYTSQPWPMTVILPPSGALASDSTVNFVGLVHTPGHFAKFNVHITAFKPAINGITGKNCYNALFPITANPSTP